MESGHHKPPRIYGKVLTEEGLELYDEFYDHFSDGGCTCFQMPPCSYCLHPGNPNNILETESLWIPDPSTEGLIQF